MTFAASFDSFPRNLALVVVFNTVVAFGLTAADPTDVFENFVRCQFIGLCVLLLIDPPTRLIWRGRQAPRKPFVLLCIAGIALGFFAGNWIAGTALGSAAETLPWATREQRAMLAVTLFAGAAASWYFWNRARIARLRLKAAALERQGSEARLRLSQVLIEPDLLLATLASLRGLVESDAPRAQRTLGQLDDYLRASLLAARKPETTLGDEFALLERYLELRALRMGERLTWSLALPKPLEAHALPPMLLQPLVENAIKHGLEPKLEGGRLEVIAQQSGDRLTLEVRDTGMGLGANSSGGSGVGVEQVRARLAANYGKRAALKLGNQTPAGAVATIELPFRQN